MKIKPIFACYDLWIGLFYDQTKRRLYVFPVPMFGFYVDFGALTPTQPEPTGGQSDDT